MVLRIVLAKSNIHISYHVTLIIISCITENWEEKSIQKILAITGKKEDATKDKLKVPSQAGDTASFGSFEQISPTNSLQPLDQRYCTKIQHLDTNDI